MRIIGVTGGIGSGKSTVSQLLGSLGARIIDADIIAREVVKRGEKALCELVEHFGTGIVNAEGELDRKMLAGMTFGNQEKIKVLNGIVHKYVIEKIFENINKAEMENAETVVIDVPIPVKHGFMDLAHEVWVVIAPADVRIDRVMKRSGLTHEEVIKRINSQISDEEYLKIANRVIYNDKDFESLKQQVLDYFQQGDAIAKNR